MIEKDGFEFRELKTLKLLSKKVSDLTGWLAKKEPHLGPVLTEEMEHGLRAICTHLSAWCGVVDHLSRPKVKSERRAAARRAAKLDKVDGLDKQDEQDDQAVMVAEETQTDVESGATPACVTDGPSEGQDPLSHGASVEDRADVVDDVDDDFDDMDDLDATHLEPDEV